MEVTVKPGIKITGWFVILMLLYSYTSVQASAFSHYFIPLSSLQVKGAVNIEASALKKENALISLNFKLNADTNGIFPTQEDVIIGFLASGKAGNREQCFIIYIPANSFEKIMHSYEIYEGTNPSDIGIKVLVVDERSGEILKDLSNSLSFFNSIIMPLSERAQYNLTIDVIFGLEKVDLTFLDLIASSSKSVLTVGDDSGSAIARDIYFQQP
jgi:hypothetical protein